ncbi:O-antigen ligase family protein [Bacillus ndiopicus]|uniref:O-antigen ligase family protein n=1 Tax=Bacillus ndiopicus TaxID=1347368 RepID=UPI0005A91720|nr:O-antigen ligase family protein [Bacillus ndiopicus]
MASFYENLHKSNAMNDEKENAQSRASVDKWIFRLLLLLIGFMPLIVMANVEEVISPLISKVDILSSGTKGDLFTHYKALLLVFITVIASVLLFAKLFFMGGTIRKTKLNYALGLFAVTIIISTIASPTMTVALNGLYNRSDGAISWLCYVILMFIAMNIEYPKKVLNYILYSLYPFVLINLFIITMNFYGKDLLQKSGMQKFVSLFLPEGANISEGSTLVGTLNQWNYMSGMFAIMTVMYLMAAVLEKGKVKYGYLFFAIMSISVLLMSVSTTGFLTFVILLFFIILAAFRTQNKIKSLVVIAVFLTVSALVFHVLASKNSLIWTESVGVIFESNPYVEENKDISFKNQEYNINWISRAYATDNFELPKLPERHTSLGNGRVYIWGKTMNLIAQRPLVGYGLDTLVYNFPHYNIDSRAGIGYEFVITDKPHSIYMGLFYGVGTIGFLAVLIIIVSTLVISIKVIIKKHRELGIIYIAWSAYLLQALLNDSLPSISAPMWILAGIMMALTFTHKESINGRNN